MTDFNKDIVYFAKLWGYVEGLPRKQNIAFLKEKFKNDFEGAYAKDSPSFSILSNKVEIDDAGYMSWEQFVDKVDKLIEEGTQITFW